MYENEKLDMRVKYTREWTFEALAKLLEKSRFQDIKISEIIKKAGISRATFYRNFSSKEDVVIKKVTMLFEQFYLDIFDYFNQTEPEDELFLIQAFFKRIDEEERVVDTVIRSNLEYVMVDGISSLITQYRGIFYKMVKVNKKTEPFIIDIVASSAWRLLSRWYQTGKKETPSELSKIYLSAFRSVYIALFDDKSKLNE